MTTSKNRLRLDFNDLPELKAALAGLAAGDRCCVKFDLMVVKNDENGLEGDIETVEYETPDADGGEEMTAGEAETSSEEPIIAVISRRNETKKKKAVKPAYDAEPVDETDDE